MSTATDDWILDRLIGLTSAQFEEFLFRADIPTRFIPPAVAPLSERATAVVRWIQQAPANRRAVFTALSRIGLEIPDDLAASIAEPAQASYDDRLDELYQRRDEAHATSDTALVATLNAEILQVKREKRAAGQLEAGDMLGDDGRYKLVELRGKGGFATVWKAYDREARRSVAIKVLHAEHAKDESRRERFFRGARQMAGLDHPGVVRVFEPHAEDHGWHYFVMELIDGEDLDHAVRGGRVSSERGLELILEVAEALQHAHERGLVHRDVAPANVLVGRDGRARLTDFDLVRAEDSVGGTRTSMLGRYIYAAPELLSRPQDADARTDVYALGMTLVFVYTGQPLNDAVLYEQDAFLAALACAPHVRLALARAVKRRMEDRFESVTAFGQALRSNSARADRASASVIGPLAAPAPGDIWQDTATGLTLVWIPPGDFLMGSSKTRRSPRYDPEAREEETPAHRVRITEGFWIGQHVVTNELYGRFVAEGGREPHYSRDRRFNSPQQPVVAVTWRDARAYCAWATKRTGLSGEIAFDLPTEAEWEFAARGDEGRRYPWDNAKPTPERAVWGLAGDKGAPAPVGQRPHGATPLGVHDMAGNVWEWCLDHWCANYDDRPSLDIDPCFGATRAAPRVLRGGSWDLTARVLRCAFRNWRDPEYQLPDIGFRVVCRRFRQDVDN